MSAPLGGPTTTYDVAVTTEQAEAPLPWSQAESRRSLIAGAVAFLATTVAEIAWLTREADHRPYAAAIGVVLGWTIFTVVHVILTRAAYWHLSETQLRVALAPTRNLPHRGHGWRARWAAVRWRLWDRWWTTEAPSWSVQVSVVALAVVAMIITQPNLRQSQLLLIFTLAMVAGSWTNVVVMYAVHYAKLDLRRPGLQFPGSESRSLTDYLYLALMIQSTFGTTDVTVVTSAMRRTVMVQTALAFIFNSVIVALIVSLLLNAAV